MDVFNSAQMDIYEEDISESAFSCVVRIDEERIVVDYVDKDLPCSYQGYAVEAGHFRLEKVGSHGEATLHRAKGDNFLEGYWVEGSRKGMWRIALVG